MQSSPNADPRISLFVAVKAGSVSAADIGGRRAGTTGPRDPDLWVNGAVPYPAHTLPHSPCHKRNYDLQFNRTLGYWGDGHMDDGWGLAMMLAMLGVGVLIAVAVGLAVMWTARLVLAARMARGEIDTQEYQARLDALRTGSPQ